MKGLEGEEYDKEALYGTHTFVQFCFIPSIAQGLHQGQPCITVFKDNERIARQDPGELSANHKEEK